jgi:CRP-like cAMP-binding protein
VPIESVLADRREVVSILAVDPELGEGLDAEAAATARRVVVARVVRADRGTWHAAPAAESSRRSALLIIEGLVLHQLALLGKETAELLGPGDVLFLYGDDDPEMVPVPERWRVAQPAAFAVLDHSFFSVARHWPALLNAILGRVTNRTRQLGVQLATSRVTRVDERVLISLWKLAERWGRVAPGGVLLPIPITHETLARLVGAQRPSVTTALGRLSRLGIVERVTRGWLLHGDAVAQLARLEAGVERVSTSGAPAVAAEATA